MFGKKKKQEENETLTEEAGAVESSGGCTSVKTKF